MKSYKIYSLYRLTLEWNKQERQIDVSVLELKNMILDFLEQGYILKSVQEVK